MKHNKLVLEQRIAGESSPCNKNTYRDLDVPLMRIALQYQERSYVDQLRGIEHNIIVQQY